MENSIFRDIQTQLDLNGPVLSWLEQPTRNAVADYGPKEFTVSPATPLGSTQISMNNAFSDFASNVEYTLTPNRTFTVGLTLEGAGSGFLTGNPSLPGGRGGKVTGTVKFEEGSTYKLVVGLLGGSADDQTNNGGIGAGGTAYVGDNGDHPGGAGGGYTGIFKDSVSQSNALLIAGGGGGHGFLPGAYGGDGGGSATDDADAGNGRPGGNGSSGGQLVVKTVPVNDNGLDGEWIDCSYTGSIAALVFTTPDAAGSDNASVSAVEVDGVILSDAATVYSDGVSVNIGGYDLTGSGSGGATGMFDGNLNTYTKTNTNAANITVEFTPTLTASTSLRVYTRYVEQGGGEIQVLVDSSSIVYGGGGGSHTAGGTGGTGSSPGYNGSDGSILKGGDTSTDVNIYRPGGGGGGGYYGGGAGGAGTLDTAGGGGGGSSYYNTNTNLVTDGVYGVAENRSGGKVQFLGNTSGTTTILSGLATASFVGIGTTLRDNAGHIAYRWYEEGVGALSDNNKLAGTGTTTLTLTNLISPTDDGRKLYLTADYVPGYYETGNATNEPISSGIATVTVVPQIEIIAQPSSTQTIINQNTSATVNASLTDNGWTNDLQYQWYLNGELVNDGNVITIINESETVSGPIERTYTEDDIINIGADSTSIEVTCCGGAGGDGANDQNGNGGTGGQGRGGKFSFSDGAKQFKFVIGKKGNSGAPGNNTGGGQGGASNFAAGGNGGDPGTQGNSGGGGGGGGASAVYEDVNANGQYDRNIIISAGGGGGGGGSLNSAGSSGANTRPGVGLGYGRGSTGSSKQGTVGNERNGDGGGGGGGGGGSGTSNYTPFSEGGSAGQDNGAAAGQGSGGASAYDSTRCSFNFNGFPNAGDGYISLKWTGTVTNPVTTTRTTIVSGSKTPTLTLQSDKIGIQTATCKISSATATNSPVETDAVNFAILSDVSDAIINIESIGTNATEPVTASLGVVNLINGEYEFLEGAGDPNTGEITNVYSFYSPDRDIEVEMDLYGSKGKDVNSNAGGEGGYSRIRFTMEKNVEYALTGLTPLIGAPFLYRKSTLIACVGGGGQAGPSGKGGAGGGVNIAGEDGTGLNAGRGGYNDTVESIGPNGVFGSLQPRPVTELLPGDVNIVQNHWNGGGRTITCAKGVYWADQGFSACEDLGNIQFRLQDGAVVTNTATIERGYKVGYNIMRTAGRGSGGDDISVPSHGNGGTGATGGWGGASQSGGGGGSGYQDGSVTVVSTQLGGSTGDAKAVLRFKAST